MRWRTRWYVNKCEEHRRYGGPEEGGWWFGAQPVSDASTIVTTSGIA